jgi:hypothetical protein
MSDVIPLRRSARIAVAPVRFDPSQATARRHTKKVEPTAAAGAAGAAGAATVSDKPRPKLTEEKRQWFISQTEILRNHIEILRTTPSAPASEFEKQIDGMWETARKDDALLMAALFLSDIKFAVLVEKDFEWADRSVGRWLSALNWNS